ncbi:MAG: DJ-1/PfpI family protein [Lachnospiraceae bacterium]|nr:DJ-1/PfpI family protein [Lachnospiraceae bacterium]
MDRTCYVFLAEGFEEIEALTVVDLLRRAGIKCTTVSINDADQITGSHSITVACDAHISDINIEGEDVLILPGGMPGTSNLAACETLSDMLIKANENKQMICAICAAPTVLGGLKLLDGKKATCYPGCEDRVGKAICVEDEVVTDGNITTSRGMGTAIPFGIELIRLLINDYEALAMENKIVYKSSNS